MKGSFRIVLILFLVVCIFSGTVMAEQWKIDFNGYPGVMELSGGPGNYRGRFNLHGSWEEMLDLRIYKNAIFFRRAAADQKYLGVMDGPRMSGIFSQRGAGSYPWKAERSYAHDHGPYGGAAVDSDSGITGNLALKKRVRQSSTGYGGNPERAVDGNRDGNYNAGSVSHTNNSPNEWWEVDLGRRMQISRVKIWNRTDCCGERLSNFYVLVSSRPFRSNSLHDLLNDPDVWSYHYGRAAGRETTIPVSAAGRYVRIQLAGQNWLSLAEVEVLGE